MLELSQTEWALALVAALGLGASKGGFAGFGLFHVVVFAFLFGAKKSTGIVLPMLLCGDLCAVASFRQHARWDYMQRLALPTAIGVVVGWTLMDRLSDAAYKPVIGSVILGLAAMQAARMWRPTWFERVPHARWFAWSLGFLAGFTTMLANGGGTIIALYLVVVSLPKIELIGTTSWFFLLLNVFKIPFSTGLGLISFETLAINAVLLPVILVGFVGGRWLIHRVSQRLFDTLVLAFSGLAALRFLGVF